VAVALALLEMAAGSGGLPQPFDRSARTNAVDAGAFAPTYGVHSGALPLPGRAPAVALPYPNWGNLSTGPTGAAPSTVGTLAYDAAAGYVVWVGGSAGNPATAQTWTYHQGVWTNRTSSLSPSPPASPLPSMTYDAHDGYMLLVVATGSSPLVQTWSYDSLGWTNRTSGLPSSPAARQGASMTYDPGCSCAVLFGGAGGGAWLNDTWTYSGSWSEVIPVVSPAPRESAGFAVDPTSGMAVLVGGFAENGPLADTWTFSSGAWTQVTGAGTPTGIVSGPNSIAPAADGTLVAYGGLGCAGTPFGICNRTFEFTGDRWSAALSATAPPPREGMELVYDAADGYVLGYGGGFFGTASNETWSLGGPMVARLYLDPAYSQPPNQTIITTVASGGYGAYHYNYSFPGTIGGTDCPSVDAPSYLCIFDFDDFGNRTVSVNVTDSVGNTTVAANELHLAPPDVVSLVVSAAFVDVGDPVEFTINTLAAYPGVQYLWAGLPHDCLPATTANVTCATKLAGFYAVSCTVVDALGTRVVTPTFPLTVFPDPSVALGADRLSGPAPLAVAFNWSVVGGLAPFAINWSFGDGAGSDLSAPDHVYASSGSYTVTATVSDATGHEVRATESRPIVVSSALNVSITVPRSVSTAPTTVELLSGVTGGVAPYSYAWTLPDGSSSTNSTARWNATAAGSFVVRLTVIDAAGTSAQASALIAVPAPATGSGSVALADSVGLPAALAVVALAAGLFIGRWWGRRHRTDRAP